MRAIAQDEKQSSYLRHDCAKAMKNLGIKDKALEVLLDIFHNPRYDDKLKHQFGNSTGKPGFKEKAVDILVELYWAHPNKYTDKARKIYNSLWDLTEV